MGCSAALRFWRRASDAPPLPADSSRPFGDAPAPAAARRARRSSEPTPGSPPRRNCDVAERGWGAPRRSAALATPVRHSSLSLDIDIDIETLLFYFFVYREIVAAKRSARASPSEVKSNSTSSRICSLRIGRMCTSAPSRSPHALARLRASRSRACSGSCASSPRTCWSSSRCTLLAWTRLRACARTTPARSPHEPALARSFRSSAFNSTIPDPGSAGHVL